MADTETPVGGAEDLAVAIVAAVLGRAVVAEATIVAVTASRPRLTRPLPSVTTGQPSGEQYLDFASAMAGPDCVLYLA